MAAEIRPLRFLIQAKDSTSLAFARVKQNLGGLTQMWDRFRERGRRAVEVLKDFGLSLEGLKAPFQAMGGWLELFDGQAKAVAQVETVIKSTGGVAGRTARELQAMASALQGRTLFGDEEILQHVIAPLLTFTRIHGAVFDRATASVLDYAQALGTDLQSAAIQVGKALNDPIAGISALGEAGVQFTEAQKVQIEALVEAGKMAEAQGHILAELGTQFAGSAIAAAEAGTGWLTQLQNAWGDFGEVVGGILNDTLKPMAPALQDMVAWLTELDPAVQRAAVAFTAMYAIVVPLLGAVSLLVTAIGIIGGPVTIAIAAIAGLVAAYVAFKDDIDAALTAAWGWISGFWRDTVTAMTNLAAIVESNARSIWASFDNWLDRNVGISVSRFLGHVRSVFEELRGVEITLADGRHISLRDRISEVYGLANAGELSAEANGRVTDAFADLASNVAGSVNNLETEVLDAFVRMDSGTAAQASATAANVTSRYDELAEGITRATGSARTNALRDFEELHHKLPQLSKTMADEVGASWLDFKQVTSGLLSELFDISSVQTFAERMVGVFDRMADRIMDQALRPLEQAIGGVLNTAFAPPSSGASGFFGNVFSSFGRGGGSALPIPKPKLAFASGGSFTVGGAGGVDSQVVAFRATPGERVDVRTPGQASASAGVHVHFHGVTDAGSFKRNEAQITADLSRAVARGRRSL